MKAVNKIGKILGSIGLGFITIVVLVALFGGFDDEVAELTDGKMADNERVMVETEDGVLVEVETGEETEEPGEAQISAADDEHQLAPLAAQRLHRAGIRRGPAGERPDL